MRASPRPPACAGHTTHGRGSHHERGSRSTYGTASVLQLSLRRRLAGEPVIHGSCSETARAPALSTKRTSRKSSARAARPLSPGSIASSTDLHYDRIDWRRDGKSAVRAVRDPSELQPGQRPARYEHPQHQGRGWPDRLVRGPQPLQPGRSAGGGLFGNVALSSKVSIPIYDWVTTRVAATSRIEKAPKKAP